jgi:Family of unknown function (DUF6502)
LRPKIRKPSLATDDVLVALLAPISRLTLTSGVGIDQLVRAARQAYVEAALEDLFPAGARINISRLSVATGLTRKEVSLVVDKLKGRTARLVPRVKEQRAIRVLRGWRIDPRFHRRSGEPAQLSLRGGRKAFASLVKLYGGDVTPTSVLRELERMDAISVTRSGLLRMRAGSHRLHSHAPQRMLEVARLLGDFAGTVSQSATKGTLPAFFGYRDCTVPSPDDAALFQRSFSERAVALLESFDQWRGSRRETRRTDNNGPRVGIGVYLVRKGIQTPILTNRTKSKARSRRVAN